jgi:hypothetical protein
MEPQATELIGSPAIAFGQDRRTYEKGRLDSVPVQNASSTVGTFIAIIEREHNVRLFNYTGSDSIHCVRISDECVVNRELVNQRFKSLFMLRGNVVEQQNLYTLLT